MESFTTFVPTYFGSESFLSLGKLTAALNMKKALILCSKSVMQHGELAQKMLKDVSIQSVVCADIQPEPTDQSIERVCAFARREKGIDGIIAIGGGSCMDTAKCVNVLLNNEGTIEDFASVGGNRPTVPGFPLVLIPTTAGTGAECTYSSIFISSSSGRKMSVRKPNCTLARLAIVDPQLSRYMPGELTVATGIDALCHAVEAYTVLQTNPVSDALAKEAISLIYRNLPQALCRGDEDLCVRQDLANAASMAGMAFANSMLHLVHAIGHSLGTVLHKPHGLMVGQALPAVVNLIADAVPDRIQTIGSLIDTSFAEDASKAQIGRKTAQRICEFYEHVGFPTLKELGATREQAFEAEKYVRLDGCFAFSPQKVSDAEIHDLLIQTYERRF